MDTSGDFENIWNEFNSGLKTFILSRVRNDADAEDILHSTWLKIHDNIHTLKDRSKIKSWIYQIARNLIIDHFRAGSRYVLNPEIATAGRMNSSFSRIMDTAVEDMIRMMDEMPPEYCEALCLTEIEGMSQKQYAEKAGLSYSGAKSRIQRARIILKDMLLRCCHYHFDRYGTVIDIQPKCCCCVK